MCGIIGIVGKNNENVVPEVVAGLEHLEYRGYDSSGLAVLESDGKIARVRSVGKLANLKEKLSNIDIAGNVGIGHTRWATHGKPTENNAHPMVSKNVAVIHNGIIENYKDLKFSLEADGYIFESETDTEVISHYLQRELDRGFSPREAFRNAIDCLEGTYAIAAIFTMLPNTIMVSRLKSSLVVGFGKNICIASDAGAISNMCDEVVYLEDGDIAEITQNDAVFFDKNFNSVNRKKFTVEKSDVADKGSYQHFMLKEIMDQPNAIRNTLMRNKIDSSILDNVNKILIIACGTSYYAGMVAKYWFENFLRIPTDVEIASEFRYRNPVILENTLVISISQSGETVDTIGAIEYIRSKSDNKTIAIVNVKSSATARISDLVLYTEAGVEMSVASTKAFTAQLAILASIAFCKNTFLLQQLHSIPTLCEQSLELSNEIKSVAELIYGSHNAIYLGRGTMYPLAMEGALKLKEISYIHAEGVAAGEMKHGSIALIDENVPVIFLCPNNELFDKTASNLQEVLARGKNVIVITDEKMVEKFHENVRIIRVPNVKSAVSPILYSIPLQLLAYHASVLKGTDIDRPRNLAKSVTVE
jgi:glucosamine--fructose-6-phosphate aminotransferase (isomerizing)